MSPACGCVVYESGVPDLSCSPDDPPGLAEEGAPTSRACAATHLAVRRSARAARIACLREQPERRLRSRRHHLHRRESEPPDTVVDDAAALHVGRIGAPWPSAG